MANPLQKANASHCPSSDTRTEIINGRFVTHGCNLDEGEAALIYVGVVVGVLAVVGLIAWAVSNSSKEKEQEGLKEIESAYIQKDTYLTLFSHYKRKTPRWFVVENVQEGNLGTKIGINLFSIISRN